MTGGRPKRRHRLFGGLFKRSPSPSPSASPGPSAPIAARPQSDGATKHEASQAKNAQVKVPEIPQAAPPPIQQTTTFAPWTPEVNQVDHKPLESGNESLNPGPPNPADQPTIPPKSRNLSEEALQALPIETQTEVRKLIPASETAQLSTSVPHQIHALVKVVESKQEEYVAKFWKINIFGQDIVIRDYVNATLSILEQVGDVAINFAPAPGSIVWSAVKTLTQMHVAGEAELCVLLMVAQKITPILCRIQSYESVYNAANTEKSFLEPLESVAIQVYTTSYQILAHTSKELASKLRRVRHALLSPGQTTEMIAQLERLEAEHERAIKVCHRNSVSQSSHRVDEALTNLKDSLNATEKSLLRVEAGVDRLVTSDNLSELNWISNVQYTDDHNSIATKRAENTGIWLPNCPSFQRWEGTESSALFWLEGTVGTGKSFLSSSVIDHLLESFMASPEDGGFAFFYCNQQYADHRESLSILRSFVRQLSTTCRSQSHMRKELHDACSAAKSKGSHLTKETCLEHLVESVNLYPQTVIVLDGLDECEKKERKSFLEAVDRLFSQCKKPLKVYIASRPIKELQDWFKKERDLKVGTSDNVDDIRTFVNKEIRETEEWDDEEVSIETKEMVMTALIGDTSDSPAMFRWVALQLEQLFECRSDSDIRDRLGKLPPDLDKSYDEIYHNKIQKLPKTDKAHADRAFMWMMCTMGRPTSNELLAAVRLTPDGKLDSKVTENTLLILCQHLLVMDPVTKTWRFPHASVAEYFQTHHFSLAQAHSHVAKVCLSQLAVLYSRLDPEDLPERQKSQGDEATDPSMPEHSIQQYMREHWPAHVRMYEDEAPEILDPELVRLLKSFLGHPAESSVHYRRWLSHMTPHFNVRESWEEAGQGDLEPSNLALLSMAHFSIVSLLRDWWEGADLSVENSRGWNLYAVTESVKVCEVLHKRGLDASRPMRGYGSALAAAIERQNADVIEFLVRTASVDVNLKLEPGSHGSALVAAIWDRNMELVRLLVEEGQADVNMSVEGKYSASALIAAIEAGRMDILQYLVHKAKADVNIPVMYGDYGSALEAAAFDGELRWVEFLVNEAGADVNLPPEGRGRTGGALALAAESGSISTVEFLVKNGANVNMQLASGRYGSALAAAAANDLEVTRFLVQEAGADVNMRLQGGSYPDALTAAAEDNFPCVKFLVEEAGAKIVTDEDDERDGPITTATEADQLRIVKYLERRLKGLPTDDLVATGPASDDDYEQDDDEDDNEDGNEDDDEDDEDEDKDKSEDGDVGKDKVRGNAKDSIN